jgi:hypothetical protein
MDTIAKTLIAIALATPVAAVPTAAADSVVRVHASNAAGLERFLPALPADVLWLATNRRAPQKNTVLAPEAGTVTAWMLAPIPAKAWSSRRARSPGSTPSFAGM